jgi:hypothetical protein
MSKDLGLSTDKRGAQLEPSDPLQLDALRTTAASQSNTISSPTASTNAQPSTHADQSLFSGTSDPVAKDLQARLARRLEREQQRRMIGIEEKLASKEALQSGAQVGEAIVKTSLRTKLLRGLRDLFPHDRQTIIGKFIWWLGDMVVKLERLLVRLLQGLLRMFGMRFGNGTPIQQTPQTAKVTDKNAAVSATETKEAKDKKAKEMGRSGAGMQGR